MGTVARDWALAADPVRFSQAGGFTPDDWQARLLRSNAPRVLLNCSRQSGKSTVAGILACHTAIYEPGSLVLMVSPTERQSGELFRKALAIYRALGRPVDAHSESALQLELQNGSRIVALPGKEGTIRSYSGVRVLLIDEAARVPTETYVAVRPMLAVSAGRLVTLSTPFGTRGWWYESWRDRQAGDWDYYEVPATSCPRIAPAFLADERQALGSWRYEQEYLCRFKDAQTAAFSSADVARAFSQHYQTWDLFGNGR